VWSGSLTFRRNQFRSAPLDLFARHFDLPGVSLYSLQLGPRSADLSIANKASIVDLSPHLHTFNDTALILNQLDLVISTCTSIVHLCGALGKPCWALLDFAPHWLWMDKGVTTPWYRSVRFYRQRVSGGWDDVFDRARGDLLLASVQRRRVASKARAPA
jgi:ADP-heptose:LPS heptosyltransferase